MLSPDERLKLIDSIRTLPERLEATVSGLTDEQLDTPYGDGKWTIRQVVNHLADSHLNGFSRMKMALTENKPTLKTYDQDAWATLEDTAQFPIRSSLLILEGLHARWARLLETVSDEDWQRLAIHPEAGEETLDDLLTDYANHGDKHIGHITGLLNKKGW